MSQLLYYELSKLLVALNSPIPIHLHMGLDLGLKQPHEGLDSGLQIWTGLRMSSGGLDTPTHCIPPQTFFCCRGWNRLFHPLKQI